jgi:ABC-2 type transport system permease protein
MITLLSIEIRRLLARRIVRVAGFIILVAIIVAGIVVFVRSPQLSPAEVRARTEQARIQREAQMDFCLQQISPEEIPPGMTLEEFCQQFESGEVFEEDPRFRLTAVRAVLSGTSGFLIALLLVLGASFIGAEWHAGTMATLLTWEPRRIRVFATKVLAAACFAFVAFLIVQALLAAALIPAALLRGTSEGADQAWLSSTLGLQIRAAIVAGLATAIGFSLASVGRNTAMALGAGFVYFSILEPFLRAVRPAWQSWFLTDNIVKFIVGNTGDFLLEGRSTLGSGLLVATYALGLSLVAMELFRRRDVT